MPATFADRISLLESEGFVGLRALAKIASVHPATCHRWVTAGVNIAGVGRVKLEAVRIAGRWMSSRGAMLRFIEAMTAPEPVAEKPVEKTVRATRVRHS